MMPSGKFLDVSGKKALVIVFMGVCQGISIKPINGESLMPNLSSVVQINFAKHFGEKETTKNIPAESGKGAPQVRIEHQGYRQRGR